MKGVKIMWVKSVQERSERFVLLMGISEQEIKTVLVSEDIFIENDKKETPYFVSNRFDEIRNMGAVEIVGDENTVTYLDSVYESEY